MNRPHNQSSALPTRSPSHNTASGRAEHRRPSTSTSLLPVTVTGHSSCRRRSCPSSHFSFFRHIPFNLPSVSSHQYDTTITTFEFYPEAVSSKESESFSKILREMLKQLETRASASGPKSSKQPALSAETWNQYPTLATELRLNAVYFDFLPGHCRRRPWSFSFLIVLSSHSSGTNT